MTMKGKLSRTTDTSLVRMFIVNSCIGTQDCFQQQGTAALQVHASKWNGIFVRSMQYLSVVIDNDW